ncbi:6-carboxytetrahydropterin synthase [Mycobacterium sp.]|uniref:6-pyruvoyl trahydropterin synthase family protein n=1 Tax=Mycobacterium sp. TaxID=1785 RepID=UPI0025EEFF48|nr:6-carboxytetrahydropterin synthase [Mycobacterium sp.]MBW0014679.1 6-carboxytetrahydropterin synthase [Mycobacterium sp.]
MDAAIEVFKVFTFEAAHFLPNVATGHQCGVLHGHSYKVIVGVEGVPDSHTGFVVDFALIKCAMKPVIDQLDHSALNRFIENPTCENVAGWIWNRLAIPGLSYVEVWETATSGCRASTPHVAPADGTKGN